MDKIKQNNDSCEFDVSTIQGQVESTISQRKLLESKTHLMLMVSGGVDSTALAYLFDDLVSSGKISGQNNASINIDNIAIMHLDHMIRGNESASDCEFVSKLANFLCCKFYSYKEDVPAIAKENNDNLEAAARTVRYKCVVDACKHFAEEQDVSLQNIAICSAHNADDRIENFYMRSIVGTGPGGLASLNYASDYIPGGIHGGVRGGIHIGIDSDGLTIIRPLLDITKSQLKDYVENRDDALIDDDGNKWREDSTNNDTTKFRAFVRKNILPISKSYNKNFESNLCNTMNLIADENDFLENLAKSSESELVEYQVLEGGTSAFVDPQFCTLDIVIQRRVAYRILRKLLPAEARINTTSVASIIKCATTHNYTENIQGDLIIHSNKKGMTIETSNLYRQKRNRL